MKKKLRSAFSLAAVAALVSSCDPGQMDAGNSEISMHGGRKLSDSEFSGVASYLVFSDINKVADGVSNPVENNKVLDGVCTGSFLTPYLLLTSAHCVIDGDRKMLGGIISFKAAGHRLSDQHFSIVDVRTPSSSMSGHDTDWAIVELIQGRGYRDQEPEWHWRQHAATASVYYPLHWLSIFNSVAKPVVVDLDHTPEFASPDLSKYLSIGGGKSSPDPYNTAIGSCPVVPSGVSECVYNDIIDDYPQSMVGHERRMQQLQLHEYTSGTLGTRSGALASYLALDTAVVDGDTLAFIPEGAGVMAAGDSGGPLMAKDSSGNYKVIGVNTASYVVDEPNEGIWLHQIFTQFDRSEFLNLAKPTTFAVITGHDISGTNNSRMFFLGSHLDRVTLSHVKNQEKVTFERISCNGYAQAVEGQVFHNEVDALNDFIGSLEEGSDYFCAEVPLDIDTMTIASPDLFGGSFPYSFLPLPEIVIDLPPINEGFD